AWRSALTLSKKKDAESSRARTKVKHAFNAPPTTADSNRPSGNAKPAASTTLILEGQASEPLTPAGRGVGKSFPSSPASQPGGRPARLLHRERWDFRETHHHAQDLRGCSARLPA